MKTKYILEKITDQYLKNISNITKEFTDTIHLIYRENDFLNEPEVEGYFGDLEEISAKYASYKDDIEGMFFHEEDIFLDAKKTKENYDTYK